jgi:hypothetical protein
MVGNRAAASILQRAAGGERVLARDPDDAQDAQRRAEVARGDRVHDDAMAFLEGKLKALYSALPVEERAKFRASGGEDTIAIGMVTRPDDPKGHSRLVYTTAGNRASDALKAAAEKLDLTRWEVDPISKRPDKQKGKEPAETKPPRVHGPNDGPPELTGGIEHAEQLMALEAENERFTIKGMVVSRAPCDDCEVVLRRYKKGRITISVVLDDAPDAPKLPNKREERWQRKQPQKPGTGPEHDPGDEDDSAAARRRRKQKPPGGGQTPSGGGQTPPGGGKTPSGGGQTPSGGGKPADADKPAAVGTSQPTAVEPQPRVTHAPPPTASKAPVETPKAPDPEEVAVRQARAAATELFEFESGTKRLEFATEALHLGLGVWQIVSLIEQFAAAGQMATSTLAHGSPYWQAIDSAQAAVKNAKDVAEYYRNLDLRPAMPSRETDPLDWDSPDLLYQKQIEFLQVEAHIYAARKSIDGAIDELRDRYQALKDGMQERERALADPYTTAVWAEAILYADAGHKVNGMIEDAVSAYAEAKNYAFAADRFAEAAMQTLELRMRALGEQGIFHAIDTDDLRGTKLDDFNQRSL